MLLDCGFGLSECATRLARLGLAPDQLDAIILTHEHGDHAGGVSRLAQKFNIPVWLTRGTFRALGEFCPADLIHEFYVDGPFAIGALCINPFPVPHDAREPAQFVLTDGALRLGVLTDAGSSTPHIEVALSGCHALVLECNHDADLLARSNYPTSLKARVGGRFGHLDNSAAAELLRRVACASLQHLVAAHLSQQNNTPELARAALSGSIGCDPEWVMIADQNEGLDWREIT